ncbi:MAG: acyclic terpene utilization AtuA family protein [Gemmataceae bacterium]
MALRIGNGCGFWGDNLDAPVFLTRDGSLDYLTLEYLAELTMSILAVQKERDPEAGFAGDFLDVLGRLLPLLAQQPRLKIVTNAGGMNPSACARRAQEVLKRGGLARSVAVVTGDDLLPRLDRLIEEGHPFLNLDTGQPLSDVRDRVVSANAYLGAQPIVQALKMGADIVITGRVADASLTVAPAVHAFGWNWADWDRLAAATVAGHLIECGAQATGGLWTNWRDATDLANVGYPIAHFEDASGAFRIEIPPGHGGAVNRETISEQLLYEVADPARYLTPDVVADFTSVTLTENAANQVTVTGARGLPATDSYKVSIAYRDGFAASGTLVLFGADAEAKARAAGAMLLQRLDRIGAKPEKSLIEALGTGACAPGVVPAADPVEVVLRVSVRDSRRAVVERFTKEFAPLVTSGPPGVTGYTTGRPPVREVFAYWPALVAKTAVTPKAGFVVSPV